MKHFVRAIPVALLLLSVLPHLSSAQVPEVRERLGGRLGYVDTFSGTHEHYGAGWNANIYFTERLWKALFLDIRIGAIYLGDLLQPEVAQAFTGVPVDSEMRTLFFSVGPQIAWSMSERITPYFGAGIGVYSTSVIFATSIQSVDLSDQHLGGNGSVGVLLRFTNTWNLDLNVTLHHFRTSSSIGDLFYIFTGRSAEDPFMLQAAVGLTIDLR
jgi:hypothetical protein